MKCPKCGNQRLSVMRTFTVEVVPDEHMGNGVPDGSELTIECNECGFNSHTEEDFK